MRYQIILTILFIFILGCGKSDGLKSHSMNAAKILREAANKLKTTKTENVIKDGKITGTEVYLNNTDSKKYLSLKEPSLQKDYKEIKEIYLSGKAQSFDALCVMAILNEYTWLLSMNAIDEECTYTIKLNELKNKKLPSDWILEDFFHSIFTPPWFHDTEWKTMSRETKFETMVEHLMVSCEKK